MAVSLAASVTLAATDGAWREVRGDHFALRARAGVKNLGALACDIDRVRIATQRVYRGTALSRSDDSRVPSEVSIIAVDNERDLRELLSQFWERRGAKPLGAYWSGPYGHHIVLRVDVPARERFRRVLHEYAHFATHVEFGAAAPWLDEGLSELWTNAAVEGDGVEIGKSVSAHLKLLHADADWIPLEELVEAKTLPPSSERKRLARFYAESWALVHFLVFERNGGRLAFDDIPAAPPSDETLRRYIKQSLLPTIKLPIPSASANADLCTAAEGGQLELVDSLIRQAQALTDGERPAAALPLLRRAAVLAPSDPQIAEMTGVVQFLTSDVTAAAAAFDRLIASGTASHLSYYYRAILAEAGTSAGAESVPVADYLRRAVSLAPGFSPARERLAAINEHP